MANNTRLADLCEAVVDCPHSTPKWTEAGVLVLRSHNIRNGRLDVANASYTDETHFTERTRRATPKAGDIIITREAPMGEVCMIPQGLRCCLGQRMVLLRPNRDKVDGNYLLYALQSPQVQHEIRLSEGTGSTVSNLRIPLLESLNIPCPPINEQREIARILRVLDDKIEVNGVMGKTLERIALEMFNALFVNFEPVLAHASGRESALPRHIAAMFPSTFRDAACGRIPSDWQCVSIEDVAEQIKGKSYKSEDLKDSDTALVTLKSFERGGGYRTDGLKAYTGDYKDIQVVSPGELIIACTDVTQAAEVIGRPARVLPTSQYDTLVASLDVAIIRPRDDRTCVAFLYGLGRTERFTAHMRAHSSGTTVLHLAKGAIPSYQFALPPADIMRCFEKLVSPIYERIAQCSEEAAILIEMRDALLPKLMSGQMHLKEQLQISKMRGSAA